ncbi:MAG: hypothetical protein K2X91_04065 [Thermoleophilia bacterium]|nr:hypothetical protein [Thermoleophilia bacterium]
MSRRHMPPVSLRRPLLEAVKAARARIKGLGHYEEIQLTEAVGWLNGFDAARDFKVEIRQHPGGWAVSLHAGALGYSANLGAALVRIDAATGAELPKL